MIVHGIRGRHSESQKAEGQARGENLGQESMFTFDVIRYIVANSCRNLDRDYSESAGREFDGLADEFIRATDALQTFKITSPVAVNKGT
jgi:hypothetical protein